MEGDVEATVERRGPGRPRGSGGGGGGAVERETKKAGRPPRHKALLARNYSQMTGEGEAEWRAAGMICYADVDKVVPIRLDFDCGDGQIQDILFCPLFQARQVRAFAEQYVQEMALPLEAVGVVEGSIRVQLEQAQEIMTFPIPVDQPHLITINVNFRLDSVLVQDNFQWDINSRTADPDKFAEQWCADMLLDERFVVPLAHTIRDQVLEARKAWINAGFPSQEPEAVALREYLEFPDFEPLVHRLDEEEFQKVRAVEDRKARIRRRNKDLFGDLPQFKLTPSQLRKLSHIVNIREVTPTTDVNSSAHLLGEDPSLVGPPCLSTSGGLFGGLAGGSIPSISSSALSLNSSTSSNTTSSASLLNAILNAPGSQFRRAGPSSSNYSSTRGYFRSDLYKASEVEPIAIVNQPRFQPFDSKLVRKMDRAEELDDMDLDFCVAFKLTPENFIRFRDHMIKQCQKDGFLLKKTAREMLRISVHKSNALHTYLLERGIVNLPARE